MEAVNKKKLSAEEDDETMSVNDEKHPSIYKDEQPLPSGRYSRQQKPDSSRGRRISIYLTLSRMFGRDTSNRDLRDAGRPRDESHHYDLRPSLNRPPDSLQYQPSHTSNIVPPYKSSNDFVDVNQSSPSNAAINKDRIKYSTSQNNISKPPKNRCNKLWFLIILLLLVAIGVLLFLYLRPSKACSEGPPLLDMNGKILDKDTILDSPSFPAYTTFTYSCDEGYSLSTEKDTVTCREDGTWTLSSAPSCTLTYQTCSGELKTNPGNSGKVVDYSYPGGNVNAFCDYIHEGGGWVVILKRFDGSQDFFKEFADYVKGFGSLEGEYWLGLDKISSVTNSGTYELRIDLEDFDGNKRFAKYSTFKVGEGPDYILSLGKYFGDAGNSFASSNGVKFSARDLDQDTSDVTNCAARFKGGWWFESCFEAFLTGQYLRGDHDSYADGIHWRAWRGFHYSLKKADMKIRLLK